MTSIMELTLHRQGTSPWGFRLQGGADFEKALAISSVTDGSPSQTSGLQIGDIILRINGLEAMLMTHKQGQDAIVSAGNSVPLVIQRFGGPELPTPPGTWKPKVDIIGGPATNPANPGQTYTKTSLVAPPIPEDTHWDVKHNITAKGFQPVASTLAEPRPVSAPTGPPGFKSISAPISKPISGPPITGPPLPQVCWQCSKPISGVFLQIKGRPIHGDCFVCQICRCSLKNVGHFLIAEKLYCQTHAMVAQAQLQGGDSETPSGPPQSQPGQQGGGMPQGLAANLARLSVRPQGPSVGPPCPPGPPRPTGFGPSAPAPAGPAPGSAAWEDKLNANTAGVAGNAEDFTKEFMKQLTGGQSNAWKASF